MRRFSVCLAVACVAVLATPWGACASPVDFNFSISYSGSSITGRLIGLELDSHGNATEIDPTSVLIYSAPPVVGLGATQANPYVFVPHTFQRSTYFSGIFTSTIPNVYGFQVANYGIAPAMQNLLMSETGGDVTLVFNFGASLGGEGGVATYGIQAEEDALWPAINSFVSFSAVSIPPPAPIGDANGDCTVGAADYALWAAQFGQTAAGLSADFDGNSSVGAGDYALWAANFGHTCMSAGARVPEPSSWILALMSALAWLAAGQPRRRRSADERSAEFQGGSRALAAGHSSSSSLSTAFSTICFCTLPGTRS